MEVTNTQSDDDSFKNKKPPEEKEVFLTKNDLRKEEQIEHKIVPLNPKFKANFETPMKDRLGTNLSDSSLDVSSKDFEVASFASRRT